MKKNLFLYAGLIMALTLPFILAECTTNSKTFGGASATATICSEPRGNYVEFSCQGTQLYIDSVICNEKGCGGLKVPSPYRYYYYFNLSKMEAVCWDVDAEFNDDGSMKHYAWVSIGHVYNNLVYKELTYQCPGFGYNREILEWLGYSVYDCPINYVCVQDCRGADSCGGPGWNTCVLKSSVSFGDESIDPIFDSPKVKNYFQMIYYWIVSFFKGLFDASMIRDSPNIVSSGGVL